MELSDIVFGRTTITEPVLQELLLSPELNRLKHISSAGYYPAVPEFHHEQVNRFVHSVGVFMLLRRFGAPLEEQIAGLLHDVSHSAFSHTVDYIKKDTENGRTYSNITPLSKSQRIEELARIMGGLNITDALLNSAAEMLKNSQEVN